MGKDGAWRAWNTPAGVRRTRKLRNRIHSIYHSPSIALVFVLLGSASASCLGCLKSIVNMVVSGLSLFLIKNPYESYYRIPSNVPEVFVFFKNDNQIRYVDIIYKISFLL